MVIDKKELDQHITGSYGEAQFERQTILFCSNCEEHTFEDELEGEAILNIEENTAGEDVLTFTCPNCNWTAKSRRYDKGGDTSG